MDDDDDDDDDDDVRDAGDGRCVRDVRDEFRVGIGAARRTRVEGVATVRERTTSVRRLASCWLDVRERVVGVRRRGGLERDRGRRWGRDGGVERWIVGFRDFGGDLRGVFVGVFREQG